MKESKLYLDFLKKNLFILLTPVFALCLISFFLYLNVPKLIKTSQSFKLVYSLENIGDALPLTDQVVSELRIQNFASNYEKAQAVIYKIAPLNIAIEVTALNNDDAYQILTKEVDYLSGNFSISRLNSPEITQVEPSLIKYLLTGISLGFVIGLLVSLIREYLNRF